MSAGENPQASVTLGSVSNLSSFLANLENVRAVYAALSQRERLIGSLLDSVNSQRGLATMDPVERLIRIRDSAPILEDIPSYSLGECFKRAVKCHDYRHPFQVSEVAAVWVSLSEQEKESLYRKSGATALPAGPACEWCNGRGMMRVKVIGCYWPRRKSGGSMIAAVNWDSAEETNFMLRCRCRKSDE